MNFSDFNIQIPSGSSGTVKTRCPNCTPHNRKPQNRNAKDLSVNITEGCWKCHNCNWTGGLKQKKQYTKPTPIINISPISEKATKWFDGRGIKQQTLKTFGILEKKEWMPQKQGESNCVVFPYVKNGDVVNYKFRDGAKNFKMCKDAELTLFNVDAIFGQKRALIVEGEIDALSVHQAGFKEVVSVPNGATKGNQRLDYLDNSWYAFSDCEIIYIATDNDEAGIALRNELARRLGKDICVYIEYPSGCKDMNEVLVKYDINGVWNCINNHKRFPIEGVFKLTDFSADLDNIYENGYVKGFDAGYEQLSELINFSTGQVTCITGIPNSGKSAFTDQLLMNLALMHNINIAVCSFENQPITQHAGNLCSLHSGKPFYSDYHKMSREEYLNACSFLNDHFFWLALQDADCTVGGILSRTKQLIKSYGIKFLLIDPYNYIEHKREAWQTETEYISLVLTELCNFAKQNDIHIIIVAHPTKIKKAQSGAYEVPTLYDIAGSAHWFNKMDNGIVVYRDDKTNVVTVYIQKVRFRKNGKKGYSEFTYDVFSGRYTEIGSKSTVVEPVTNAHGLPPLPIKPPQGHWQEKKEQEAEFDLF